MWRRPDEYRVPRCQTLAAVAMRHYDSDISVRTNYEAHKFVAARRSLSKFTRKGREYTPALFNNEPIKFWLLLLETLADGIPL
jgi:hypothetical protein